ncbi:MAG: sugar-transfer associated ATP-grasp domain-containing protein [Candidatus Paceibacterota bacterium]
MHLGAVGVGIDLRTGITTFGVLKGKVTEVIPEKKVKVRGIKLANWSQILEIATNAQITSKLGFVGVDIVLDEVRGPLVLEINARPGLSIQTTNRDSLRTRLERVANINVNTAEEGVELAQRLFGDETLSAVEVSDKVLGVIEKVTIYGENKRKVVRAKIDTGAYRTSIDVDLVSELELDKHHKLVHVRSGSGRQKRRTVWLDYSLKGKRIKTIATYTERSHLRFPVIIGRKDIKAFWWIQPKFPRVLP